MFGLRRKRDAATQAAYATCADFCRIFEDEMKPLYLLAFLLTTSHARAEQCFVTGITDAIKGNSVFKEWAGSWARRVIINSAIRIISPASAHADWKRDLWDEAGDGSMVSLAINAVTQLAPLERFVFVMSLMERYSDRECTASLGCTQEAVVQARMRALQRICDAHVIAEAAETEPSSHTQPVHAVA